MMNRLRQMHRLNLAGEASQVLWRACFVLLLSVLSPAASTGAQTPAASDDAPSTAALMVDTGDGEPMYVVVAFDDTDMSAVDLLRASDLSVVTVEFGGLGEGVCEIVEVGCDVSACRRRLCQTGEPDSPFWQFWQQDAEGEWALSPLGGSDVTIEDGDIVAWSWTGVDPELEPLDWEVVAERAGAPDEIVRDEPAGELGVWNSSDPATSDEEDPSLTNMLLSSAMLVLIAGIGIVLARRQRGRAPRNEHS